MGRRTQLASGNLTDAHTGQSVPEGYLTMVTSAGNVLTFIGPAERFAYQNNPANAAQLGTNRGESKNQN